MPPMQAPERRSKRVVVLSNQRVNVIPSPKQHSSAHLIEPTKLSKSALTPKARLRSTRLRPKRLSREDELAKLYSSLRECLPRLESQLGMCSEGLRSEATDFLRQTKKLVNAIHHLTDWCESSKDDLGWTPQSLGDNNSLDYQFLSRLYICGSIHEKVDKAIDQLTAIIALDVAPDLDTTDLSDESFVSQIMVDIELGIDGIETDNHDQVNDQHGDCLKGLMERLEATSGFGKRIRALLPSCPQLPTGPRCYGPKK